MTTKYIPGMSQYIAHVFLPMIAKGMSEMTQKAQFILKGLNIYCSLIILFDLWFGSTTDTAPFRLHFILAFVDKQDYC